MILVVGLGNPGPRYEATRHNVGFMVVERLLARAGNLAFRPAFGGRLAQLTLGADRALVLEPLTYMNESGRCVRAAADFYRLDPGDLVVVHDELDLPFGEVRLKSGGGDAGHRGLRSITGTLGSPEYARVRVGIGRPAPDFQGDVSDYVLDGFPLAERDGLFPVLDRAAAAVTLFAERGLSAAMNVVNQRKS